MARPSNTRQRREQIARALIQVMAVKGYDGASIADVAGAAGLTAGLVHYHFTDKLEILLTAADWLAAQHTAGLCAALDRAAGDALAQVAAFIDFHLGLGATADPEALAAWITITGEALRRDPVRERVETLLAGAALRLEGIIRRGVESGLFRGADPKAAATAILAAIQGYFVLAAAARKVIPRGSASASVKAMATGLLQPKRALPVRGSHA